jgi:methyltransferase-like protein
MLNKYVRVNEEKIAYRTINGEAIILNLKTNIFYTLNPVATSIWGQLDGKATIKDIAEKLSQELQEKRTVETATPRRGEKVLRSKIP